MFWLLLFGNLCRYNIFKRIEIENTHSSYSYFTFFIQYFRLQTVHVHLLFYAMSPRP